MCVCSTHHGSFLSSLLENIYFVGLMLCSCFQPGVLDLQPEVMNGVQYVTVSVPWSSYLFQVHVIISQGFQDMKGAGVFLCGGWRVCGQHVAPLHSFFQLFDGEVRGRWSGLRLLDFLSSTGDFLFPIGQHALEPADAFLSLDILVLTFLQLHDREKPSTSAEMATVDLIS